MGTASFKRMRGATKDIIIIVVSEWEIGVIIMLELDDHHYFDVVEIIWRKTGHNTESSYQ